jgi:hypothetical protein
MTWTDAAGVATVLDGSAGIILQADPVGIGAPNPANVVDEFVNFDGGVLVNRSRPVRQLAFGLYVEHVTRVETTIAQLAAMLQGPGTLTWGDDVHTRTLRRVIYETGLDGSGEGNLLQRSFVVSLLALDPWWYGPAASQTLATTTTTAFDAAISFDSATPFDGGGSVAVAVAGDADAYPVITVVGPVSTLTVGSGGLAWQLASALTSSDTLIVDHRPASRGPRKNGGPVDWSLLTEASRLWALAHGTATVITGATGTTGGTSVLMSWEPRFLTP